MYINVLNSLEYQKSKIFTIMVKTLSLYIQVHKTNLQNCVIFERHTSWLSHELC